MIEEKKLDDLIYLLSYPEGFREDTQYPLVVFLHGAGTRGTDTALLRTNPNFCNLHARQSKGFVLLAPLCSVNNWNETMQTLLKLVAQIRELPFVDTKRVYLTGNSMGGYGTWELGSLRPDWFAAMMPVCGGGIAWMARNLVNVPVRAFHGLRDKTVDPLESLQMVKAVNNFGGHAELILYPECAHNCWDAVYSNDTNYDWLFRFSTDRDKALIEALSGNQYG